jgi:hypothetical protein
MPSLPLLIAHTFSHQYFDFTVNALRPVSSGSGQSSWNFTVTDKKEDWRFRL